MKKIIIIILLITGFSAKGQSTLSIENLIHLRTLDLISANDYLVKKGWTFKSSSDIQEETSQIASWINSKLGCQVSLIEDSENKRSSSFLIVNSKVLFDKVKGDLMLKKPKLVKSSINTGSISTEYTYKDLRILFFLSKEADKTSYNIIVSN
ncbi:hypothetical protein [Pedobacter sp. MW01-1-1]|uniref:hypothetical protein n=1 Tax=Pedobacter sp. MW01-1-1 TaxID=3383027 RepID=UPI003FF0FB25